MKWILPNVLHMKWHVLRIFISNMLETIHTKHLLNILLAMMETARQTSNEIAQATRATMRSNFALAGLVVNSKNIDDISLDIEIRAQNVYLKTLSESNPDFANWLWTIMNSTLFHALGDTIGYYNGNWEFNNGIVNPGPEYVYEMISEFIQFGGVNDLDITNWKISDDTIMNVATLRCVIRN